MSHALARSRPAAALAAPRAPRALASLGLLTFGLLGAGVADPAAPPAAAAPSVVVQRDVLYATADREPLLLDAYLPSESRRQGRPAVILIHGGGWRAGDKSAMRDEAQRLASLGWVAFSVDYRLRTPAAFPAEIEDVQAAVVWARTHAVEYDVDRARIAALGASAGGHLAAMLATLGQGPLDTTSRVRAAVSWSGPMVLGDLVDAAGAGGLARDVLPCPPRICPDQWAAASPVTYVDPTDAPIFLANSTDELVPLAQAQAMADRLQAAGVVHQLDVLPGHLHAQSYRSQVWPATVQFLSRYLGPVPRVPPVADLRPSDSAVAAPSPSPSSGKSSGSSGGLGWLVGGVAAVVVGGSAAFAYGARRRRPRSST